MAKISILIAFLTHFLCALGQSQLSQCSEYFTYVTKRGTTDMLGQIEIPPPVANDIFYLKVALSTTPELSQIVRLELARSIKESVRHVHQGRPLLYHVYYPMNEQIPSLSAIWFNGQQYCPDPEVSENITANVELGHILFAPNETPLVYGPWQEISQPYHRNSTNYRTVDNPNYDRLNHYSGLNECGITSYYTDDTNRLISDGEEWSPGQWPWLVAIYFQDNEEYFFLCADPDDRYSGYGLTILHLKTAVEYNAFIMPICLWSGTTNLQDIVNMTGYLVGWGSDHVEVEDGIIRSTEYTGVPRMAKVPLSNVTEEANEENELKYSHPNPNHTTCYTEEGGGLVVFNTTMGRYQLRAVTKFCSELGTQFFDVAKSTSWIRQQILLT